MKKKIILIPVVFFAIATAGGMAVADSIASPSVYDVYFEAFSATPDFNQLLKLGKLGDTVRDLHPVKLELIGYANHDEGPVVAGKRIGYLVRWLKSAGITAKPETETRVAPEFSVGQKDWMRVRIRAYDQKTFYAIQDAEREARRKAEKKPDFHIAETVHSFGTALEGDPVKYSFAFRNVGEAELEIKKIRSYCGCTTVDYPERLAPGAVGRIKVRIDTSGDGNNTIKRKVRVFTSDPEKSILELFVTGYVEKFAGISPERLILAGKAGKTLQRILKIGRTEKYPFRIIHVRADDKRIDCELLKPDKKGEYKVIVKTSGKEKGRFKSRLLIRTDSSIRPEIEVPVLVKIR